MVFVCLLFNFASAKIRDVEAYRKHLEFKRERLSRLFKSKDTADTDPLDPGNNTNYFTDIHCDFYITHI